MKFVDTFDKHIKEPEISLGDYLQSKQVSLGKSVNNRVVVYLDTKFWLILRDIELGRADSSLHKKFYELVGKLSQTKKCIFPISQDTFIEITKQSDSITRNATAQLVDRLSEGVSLVSLEERVNIEIFDFFSSFTNLDCPKREDLVWTKISYCLGFLTPKSGFDEPTSRVIEKAFLDQLWTCSLLEMFEIMEKNGGKIEPPPFKIANKLNHGKFSHTHENNSYDQMFLSEIGGMVEVFKESILEASVKLFELSSGKTPSNDELKKSEAGRLYGNSMYNLFELNKIDKEFPSIRILSGLHASVRWNKNQKFKDNDMHDFHHAASALPYAQYFFTERSLCHLVTQKNTAFDVLYDCKVESTLEGAMELLENIE